MIEALESDCSSPSLPSSTRFLLYPRREPFEHGLLPISKLIFSDPFQSLGPIKQKLLQHSTESARVSSSTIADVLQIPIDHARLVIDTLASVIHTDSDPISSANPEEIETFGANVNDLILFLYIQSYKRLLPRTHKDSAAVADVWPSTSAFDGCLSALSPLQLVRSNSRRFMPSQSDEEAHQLSYLQKHLINILSLLADPFEGGGEESLVLSMERFGHLGFLVQFSERGSSQSITLNQAAPFFANSDPDMPAVPVSATHVHDWLLHCITYALECMSEKSSAKENGPSNSSDPDVPMLDVCSTSFKSCTSRTPCFVEGISKSSFVKQAADFKGSSVKVINCHDSVIYVLAPLKYAIVYGCSDATIVLGAVGKAVKVEHCERVHVITAAKRICIANCRECVFFLGVNHHPLVIGDNHKLQVAPYNTFYSQLEEHMREVGIDTMSNRWDEPHALSAVDPHDSLSHPAGISDSLAESATRLEPDNFTNFLIPKWLGGGRAEESMEGNPFQLPDAYVASQQRNHLSLGEIKEILRDTPLEDGRKRELSSALHLCFKDWLYASGNIRQLYYLQGE